MSDLFKRELAKCGHNIEIADRNMDIFNGLPREVFSNQTPIRATIKTLSGVKVFDSTNTERVATHEMKIKFIAGFTAEKWILFNGKRIKILTVENVMEKNICLKLMCTERGLDSKVVNDA